MPIKSPFPNVQIKEDTVHDMVFRDLLKFGQSVAIIDSPTGKTYTFDDVWRIARSVAWGLRAAGFRKGDVLSICLPNCPEYIFAFFGCLPLGGIVSGINPLATPDELYAQFKDNECTFVVTIAACFPKCKAAASRLGSQIKTVYIVGAKPENMPAGLENFSKLTTFPCKPEAEMPKVKVFPKSDLAVLPYSSGTTGHAKGVMLTHYTMIAKAQLFNEGNFFLAAEQGDVVIGILPFFHIFGQSIFVRSLYRGSTLITLPKYDAETFVRLIQEYKVKYVPVVPPILLFLTKDPLVDKYDISSVEAVMVGAAPVGKDLSEALMQKRPHIKYVLQGYGLTETAGASHNTPPVPKDKIKHGSCGLLLPNFEGMVVDLSTGKELGANQDGEIWIRGHLMKGYWKRPDATAETIDADGWLHTGDIGRYDDDGYFYIVDRLKDLIKVRGFQVPPAELEDLLLNHPEIRDVAVIGFPDEVSGEIPKAFVVRHEKSNLKERDVIEFLKGKVAPYKELKGVFFVNELPKSAGGKILRRHLRDQYTNRAKL